MTASSRRQRGFALLMVLWTLMLLAFIATVFGDNARTEVLLARNLVANARAEALADGGVYRAALGLTRAPRDGGFRGDGQVYIWRPSPGDAVDPAGIDADGEQVRFTVRDEGGKVDLNQAPAPVLRELFIVLGVDPQLSVDLADAIVDFRDEDEEKEQQGAEAREYKRAEVPWGPKNKPFVIVDELTYVLGMTPEIYRRALPLVTVWGQGETPHPYTAPPEVVEAVKAALKAPRGRASSERNSRGRGASDDQADDTGLGSSGSAFGSRSSVGLGSSSSRSVGNSGLSSRGGSAFGSGSGLGGETEEDEANLEQLERSGGTAFSIHAEGRTADGTVFARDATIDLTGTEGQPVSIRAWRQGERVLFPIEGEG